MEYIPHINDLKPILNDIEDLTFITEGGFKAVYKGIYRGKLEAIKVIFIPKDIEGEDLREELIGRVRREIESLRKIDSPLIVRLGAFHPQIFKIKDIEYLIYSEEFLPGESLRVKLKQKNIPTIIELKLLAISLFEAIRILKSHDLIHRDIKPDNVIATEDQQRPFVILDLGLAFKLHGSNLTRNPAFRPGTLPYMAPEMFNPGFREFLDYRSDLYSAGLTIYEYASGNRPFARKSDDDYTTMYRILNTTPAPLITFRPDLPSEFCKMIDQLIKKLPALRPASIELLLKKLRGIS